MKRNRKNIEVEIVHQILISELCFDICQSIKIIPGRGSDFLPFYYNLNFIKGIITLHSLLLSKEKSEISIKNYIQKYNKANPKADINDFETTITSIATAYKNTFPLLLRHKIAAHIDENFKHTDFTCGYIMPNLVKKHIEIIAQLKSTFFKFCNYAQDDYPYLKIKEQSDLILKRII